FLFGLAVVGLLIFSLYRAKYGAQETMAEIAVVEADIIAAEAARADLLAEFAHRSRQEWIEEFARKELGMVPARAEQFVRPVDLDGRIGPPSDPPSDEEGTDAN
ncbi:MAG: septum formation initiator family protein, partial [Pseudomonadota bacterium]